MSSQQGLPVEGVNLATDSLFVVDINVDRLPDSQPERRAFTDIEAAVAFVDGRRALLSAFLSPLGQGSDAMLYGLVLEASKSETSQAIELRFATAPNITLRCGATNTKAEFECFRRIYPAVN